MKTRVFELVTMLPVFQDYSLDPVSAVIAAHAQSLNDWNTGDYANKYADQVRHGANSVACGNFGALNV